jgi:hypothetical protein
VNSRLVTIHICVSMFSRFRGASCHPCMSYLQLLFPSYKLFHYISVYSVFSFSPILFLYVFLPILIPQLYVLAEDVIWFVCVCVRARARLSILPPPPKVTFLWCCTMTTVVILRSQSRILQGLDEVLRDFFSKLIVRLLWASFLPYKLFLLAPPPPPPTRDVCLVFVLISHRL